jgi:peptide/nickel transport system substrate-binding protein
MWFLVVMVVTGLPRAATAQHPAEGTLTLGMPFTITAALLNPAETTGLTASIVHYALHDALLKPLPGQPMAPALAESWTESPDERTYEFTLRPGLTFHNGDLFTAEDVTFGFGRYKGVFATLLHEKVQAVEAVDPHHVRFVLHAPWPDFLTLYSALVSGAGWIMPKAYTERVGEAGFQQHPIGLGPYRFVRATPGTELVLEASDHYWRKAPAVPRLIFKSVPDPTTQLAMLKTGELDIAYSMGGDEGTAVTRDPTLRLRHTLGSITTWLEFLGQWDPTSPWHDRRVRLAANLAIDKQAIVEAAGVALDRPTGSIIPRALAFALPLEPFPYDPAQAKRLLAEAGYHQGFDAGDLTPFPLILRVGEAVASDLAAVGIRTQLRILERATWTRAWREKTLKGLVLVDSPTLGNAATRIEFFVLGTGPLARGSDADVDALFHEQAGARDPTTREALLHRLQALLHERVRHAPLLERAVLVGVGPRVDEPAIGLIPLISFTAPYEELRLKQP